MRVCAKAAPHDHFRSQAVDCNDRPVLAGADGHAVPPDLWPCPAVRGIMTMSPALVLGGLTALGLLGYLVAALLRPEKF